MAELEKETNAAKCPDVVPDEQTGMTEEEAEWALKKEPRPPVPRSVFAAIFIIIIIAFAGGSWWYYRTNVLPEQLYQKATVLFEEKKYSEACPLYVRVLELRPKRKDVIYQIGYCLEMTGQFKTAIERYKEHLKILPSDGKAMLRLGWLEARSGNFAEGLPMLEKAAVKLKDPLAWAVVGEAAQQAKSGDLYIKALTKQTELAKEPEQVYTCAKALMSAGAYTEALNGFERFTKLSPEDTRGIHAVNAVKTMLGYPTDPLLVIVPGKSLGPVAIGMTKAQAREAIGFGPDAKEFTKVGGKSMLADADAEIWTFSKSMPERGMRIIFVNGKVREIETRSEKYRTGNGIGLSNFLLAKNEGKLEWRREARNSAILCLIKDGGLTFYAGGLSEAGDSAKYKKLRVHKGDTSIDNLSGFSLMNLFDF